MVALNRSHGGPSGVMGSLCLWCDSREANCSYLQTCLSLSPFFCWPVRPHESGSLFSEIGLLWVSLAVLALTVPVDQAGFQLGDPPASASYVLGLKECPTTIINVFDTGSLVAPTGLESTKYPGLPTSAFRLRLSECSPMHVHLERGLEWR